MSDELLPCPHCGGPSEPNKEGGFWWVECMRMCSAPRHGQLSDAIAAWNCRAPLLTWTTERPTVPGWYWARHPFIVDMVLVSVGQEHIDRNEFKPGSQWAGPIPEPAEPAAEGGGA